MTHFLPVVPCASHVDNEALGREGEAGGFLQSNLPPQVGLVPSRAYDKGSQERTGRILKCEISV